MYYTRSGVSQGSTLGPTLFSIMINDLPKVVKVAKCLMFADDLKLYTPVADIGDTITLQRDIDAVVEWGIRNRLHFNTMKCKSITFTRSRMPIVMTYALLNNPLERVSEIRDLGLHLDCELNFRSHIVTICKSAHKALGFVMRMSKQFSDVRVAISLYNAYVRSKLEFGAIVWDPYEKKYTLLIEKIQKKFARFVYKRLYGYYPFLYPSLFITGMISMYTLELRRKFFVMVHYYKLVQNKVDNPLTLSRLSLLVPKPCADVGEGAIAPRRRPFLLHQTMTRTRCAQNCPTIRAVALINKFLMQVPHVDIFADRPNAFCNEALFFLSRL